MGFRGDNVPSPHETRVFTALRACPLLRAASDDGIAGLAAVATDRTFKRGEVVVKEGAPAGEWGVVIEGRLAVYHLGADGRKLLFETVVATEPVAAVAALAAGRYPAWVEATAPTTLAWLSRDALLALIEAEPAFARTVVRLLANRVLNFTAVATTLSLDVPARVAKFVFERSLATGTPSAEGLVVDIGMTKGELASSLGTVPETLSRALARLKAEGLLEVRGKRVVVFDVGGLARRGEGLEE
jgi:CRP/FNR family transcriptional regulator